MITIDEFEDLDDSVEFQIMSIEYPHRLEENEEKAG